MRRTKDEIQLEELANNRTSDYICIDCGVKYLSEQQKQSGGNVTTFHQNDCGICGENKGVTSIRHYNYGKIKRS